MKRLFFILLFLLSNLHVQSQTRHAVVVGISNYPTPSGWHHISGANDIDVILPMLHANQFSLTNVCILRDNQATKNRIINEIHMVIDKVSDGDIVYFHFSGHGQLVNDIDGDEGNYGYDESIVPYDAQKSYKEGIYTGENHIVDDELNSLLWKIKQKIGSQGRLIVVLDACHSGGGSRDEASLSRGVQDIFELPKPLRINTKSSQNIDWVCISACKSTQNNYEYLALDGMCYGRLSWAISRVFNTQQTPAELLKCLIDQYNIMPSRYPQEPILDCNDGLSLVPLM